MAIDLKSQNIPIDLKVVFLAVPSIILVALFITLVYTPKNKEIKILLSSIAKLDNEIATAEVKVRRLDELKAENAKLKMLLAELREQMPEEEEVSVLLKQISDLGLDSGLIILLWKPEARKPDPKGVYVEIPVSVEVLGAYHDLGVFFSHVSRIRRIVNISNINISKVQAKFAEQQPIKAAFTASTFSAVYETEGAQAPP